MSNASRQLDEDDVTSVAGFAIRKKLGEGATSLVYEIVYRNESAALKILRPERVNDSGALTAFRRESATLAKLSHPNLIRVHEMGEFLDRPFVILEILRGEELSILAGRGIMLEVDVLKYAAGIAGALSEVHRHGFIHHDLKPENIFIEVNGQAKLIDFGFADEANKADGEVAGTLLYSAPEQAGLTNRPVDERSDLYSLGVVLYRCLAGRLPFETESTAELLQKIGSEVPVPVSDLNSQISPAFAAIISKLMLKNPDDRYQTVDGLTADLREIGELNAQAALGEVLKLGRFDARVVRPNELPLLGRDFELSLLTKYAERARNGESNAVIIEGEPGGGKTYLIRGFLRGIKNDDYLLMAGKGQMRDQLPLGPLREMFDGYLQGLARKPADAQKTEHAILRDCAQGIERYVLRLSKGFQRIIDSPIDSGADEGQEKFYNSIAQFMIQFAKTRSLLIVQLDDVQWLDQATFQIMTRVLRHSRNSTMLLLATARNDIDSRAAAGKVKTEWQAYLNEALHVRPLDDGAVAKIVTAQVGGKGLGDEFIVKLNGKAKGNPFAVLQYVYSMIESRIIVKQGLNWIIDQTGFEKMIQSGDVVQLVLARISSLAESSRKALQIAGLMGNRFDAGLLEEVTEVETPVSQVLQDGLRANMIERIDGRIYGFIHDRVREAFSGSLEASRLPDLHQRIAVAMDKNESTRDIFALSRHYSLGDHQKNPLRVCEVLLEAGVASAEIFSNDQALELLQMAEAVSLKHLTKIPFSRLHEVFELIGIVSFRKGIQEKALLYYSRCLDLVSDSVHKAKIRCLMAETYLSLNQAIKALDETKKGLSELNVMLANGFAGRAAERLKNYLLTIYSLMLPGKISRSDLPREKVLIRLYGYGLFASLISLRMVEAKQLVGRLAVSLNRFGFRQEAADPMSFYSLYLGIMGRGRACKYWGERSEQIALAANDRQAVAWARYRMAHGLGFSGWVNEASKIQIETLRDYDIWVPPRWHITTTNDLIGNNYLVRGYAREALQIAKASCARANNVQGLSPRAVTQSMLIGPASMLDENPGKAIADAEEVYRDIPAGSMDWCWNIAHKVMAQNERGDLVTDLDQLVVRYSGLGAKPHAMNMFFRAFYLHSAYAALAVLDAKKQTQDSLRLQARVADLAKVAGPAHWRAHYYIIRSSLHLHLGQKLRARAYRALAARSVAQQDSPLAVFELAMLNVRFFKATGQKSDVLVSARQAYDLAKVMGWSPRVRKIDREFSFGSEQETTGESPVHSRDLAAANRRMEAFLRITSRAGESRDPKEITQLILKEMILLFKAERGFIFLHNRANGKFDEYSKCHAHGEDSQFNNAGISNTMLERIQREKNSIVMVGTEMGEIVGSESVVAQNLRSIIGAPLILSGRLIGLVYLDSKTAGVLYGPEEAKLMDGIQSYLSSLVDGAAVTEQLNILLELSHLSGSEIDAKMQACAALDQAIRMMGAQRAFLFFGEDMQQFFGKGFGRTSHSTDVASLEGYSTSIVQKVTDTGKPILSTTSSGEELNSSKSAVAYDLKSVIAAPLLAQGRPLGVLYLDSQISQAVFTEQDAKLILAISNHIGNALDTIRNLQMREEKERLQRQLELTSAVQSFLLPKQVDRRDESFNLATFYQATEKSGGDWWYYHRLDHDNLLVVVADVTGHGVSAAMVSALIAGAFQSTIGNMSSTIFEPETLLNRMSEVLFTSCQGEFMATLSLVKINVNTGQCNWWWACGPEIMVMRQDGKVEVLSQNFGTLIGMQDFKAKVLDFDLDVGDRLFIFTDGITELQLGSGRLLGLSQLKRILIETKGKDLFQSRDQIVGRLGAFAKVIAPDDDQSFVLFERITRLTAD